MSWILQKNVVVPPEGEKKKKKISVSGLCSRLRHRFPMWHWMWPVGQDFQKQVIIFSTCVWVPNLAFVKKPELQKADTSENNSSRSKHHAQQEKRKKEGGKKPKNATCF